MKAAWRYLSRGRIEPPLLLLQAYTRIVVSRCVPAFSHCWRSTLGTQISLTASDGFTLGGYRADPPGSPKGGLVVIQEIFCVNQHIRNVCDRFAALGYASVAPAVFDRMAPNFECGYSPAEVE